MHTGAQSGKRYATGGRVCARLPLTSASRIAQGASTPIVDFLIQFPGHDYLATLAAIRLASLGRIYGAQAKAQSFVFPFVRRWQHCTSTTMLSLAGSKCISAATAAANWRPYYTARALSRSPAVQLPSPVSQPKSTSQTRKPKVCIHHY